MTKFKGIWKFGGVGGPRTSSRLEIMTRTSWMANNAIPDSIIMNMICRSLGPPVELNEPNVRSTEVALLTSKNTMRILNTIKPVTRAFTTMDAVKAVRVSVFPQGIPKISPFSITYAPIGASQVARGHKLESAYQIPAKIDSLTYVCDCQEWRNNHNTVIFTPHNPTTVDLWRFGWINDKYNGLCVPMCIGQWSHNNRLLWFEQYKCDITLAVSHFEVEPIVYWDASV